MKSRGDNMSDKEMTRYAFISHMKDYMKELLKNPLKADTDEFLHGFGIDGPSALKMLVKKTDPNDDYSAVVIRTERIKDNGYDEDGKRNKDTFEVKYKIPRKDFKKKLRNLYINLFEQNIIEDTPIKEKLDEGAWGYGILDSDSALDAQSSFATICLNVLCSKLTRTKESPNCDYGNLWANTGVLVDFLKKYKNDEIHFGDTYSYAINIVKDALNTLYDNEGFASEWSEPEKFKSSLKKVYKEVSLLEYQKDIMNVNGMDGTRPQPRAIIPPVMPPNGPIMEDGEGGGAMAGVAGATNAESSGQFDAVALGGKPLRRKSLYLTQEQIDYIKEATTTTNTGDYQFDVPMQGGEDGFYDEAMDHKNIMKKSFATNK